MKTIKSVLPKAGMIFLIFTLLCGVIYTGVVTGIAQLIFPDNANGSIIEVDGKKYGSELLGQQYTDEAHMWGRIMNIDVSTYTDENGKALMSAAHYKLDNLTVMVDNNGLQIDGSNNEVMSLGDLAAKLRAFGFDLYEIDGHDLDAIEAALSAPVTAGKPKAILAHTVKGKGISFMENQVGWHGKAPNEEQRQQALKELED